MTPEALRSLASEATQYSVENQQRGIESRGHLIALAPSLALLCAELGEALAHADGLIGVWAVSERDAGDTLNEISPILHAALAKLEELETQKEART